MSARADLCGGRSVMVVPTATSSSVKTVMVDSQQFPRLRGERFVSNRIALQTALCPLSYH
jgi:hypothetical protein